MALVLALSLVAAVVPVRPALADGSAPQMENITPEGVVDGDTWSVLTDDVTFVFDFHDEEGDLAYLELDLVGPVSLQATALAKPDPLEGESQLMRNLLADMGVTVGYNGVEEMWVVTVDTTATWTVGPGPAPGSWPAGKYDFYLEAGDAEGNQWGNNSESERPAYAHYVYYFHSIQTAIDDVTGTTLNVGPGTYNEDLTIADDLTLNGAQAGVDARDRAVPESQESRIVGVVKVTSDATNVVFDGFKFISPTRAFTPRGFNLRVESESSTIRNNIFVAEENAGHTYSGYLDFEGITDAVVEQNSFSGDLDPTQEPNVIRLGISGGGTVTVQNNEMHDVGGGGGIGVMCQNASAVINIAGNVMENTGDGIWIANWEAPTYATIFDTLSITGNDIYNCSKDGIKVVLDVTGSIVVGPNNDIYDNSGHGVYVGTPDLNITIQGNRIYNNGGVDSNIHIDEAYGTVVIDDNLIAMTPMGGFSPGEVEMETPDGTVGIYIGDTVSEPKSEPLVGDVNITGNTIVHNKIGIWLGSNAIEVEVYGNLIVNNRVGLHILGDYNIIGAEDQGNIISRNWPFGCGIVLGSNAVGNEIHYNDIALNTLLWYWLTHPEFEVLNGGPSYGLYNANPTVWADATCNWWGDASGPLHEDNPEGRGDLVHGLVLFDPWDCPGGPYVDTVAPEIDGTGAAPDMVSLWPGRDFDMLSLEDFIPGGVMSEEAVGDFEAMSDDIEAAFNGIMLPYPTGPFLSFLIVEAADNNGVAMVTVDYASVLKQLLPEGKIAKIIEEVDEERWEMTMYLLERWPMFYDCHEQDVWFTPYFTPSIFIVLGCCLGLDMDFILEIMLQEIQLGRVDIPVTVYDYSGNTNTVSATIALDIVDVQRPLAEGCNIRSTWIQPGINKWSEILDLGNLRDTPGHLLRWNPEFQRWEDYREVDGVGYWYYGTEQVELALMEVLDAYYINVEYFDQMGIVMSRDKTAPPARDVYRGWNLISLAADPFADYECCGPCPWCDGGSGFNRPYFCTPLHAALVSIDVAPGDLTGWTIVLSPGQLIAYEEVYYYEGCPKFGWPKSFCQEQWSKTRHGNPDGGRMMTIGGGYWVQMEHDDILAGFSYTPLFMMQWGGPTR